MCPQEEAEKAAAKAGTKHARGCNCSKSRCVKNYCECWQMGVKCHGKCKCTNCANGKDCSDAAEGEAPGQLGAIALGTSNVDGLANALDYLQNPPELPPQGPVADGDFSLNALMCHEASISSLPPSLESPTDPTMDSALAKSPVASSLGIRAAELTAPGVAGAATADEATGIGGGHALLHTGRAPQPAAGVKPSAAGADDVGGTAGEPSPFKVELDKSPISGLTGIMEGRPDYDAILAMASTSPPYKPSAALEAAAAGLEGGAPPVQP